MIDEKLNRAAIDVLYRMYYADLDATYSLILNEIPCNEKLRNDPTITVSATDNCLTVIGLINGILGEMGLDLIAVKWGCAVGPNKERALLAFKRIKKETK